MYTVSQFAYSLLLFFSFFLYTHKFFFRSFLKDWGEHVLPGMPPCSWLFFVNGKFMGFNMFFLFVWWILLFSIITSRRISLITLYERLRSINKEVVKNKTRWDKYFSKRKVCKNVNFIIKPLSFLFLYLMIYKEGGEIFTSLILMNFWSSLT